MFDREEVAWAAGLFEGEGCIAANSTGYPILVLTQLDPEPLVRFAAAMQVGVIRKVARKDRYNLYTEWRTNGFERVQYCIAILWPWLSERRRLRATEILVTERLRNRPTHRTPEGAKATEDACKRGHLRSAEGWIGKDGKWHCRKCGRDNARRRRGSTGIGYIARRSLNDGT